MKGDDYFLGPRLWDYYYTSVASHTCTEGILFINSYCNYVVEKKLPKLFG